ncbi:hypothetical protein ACLB2K_033303 [Fragaria x ananassa]
MVGVIASLMVRICCSRGASANLLHLTLVITAVVCCWIMWAIVYIAQMKPLIVPILSEGEDSFRKNVMENRPSTISVVLLMLLLLCPTVFAEVLANPASGCGCGTCPANDGECTSCIVNQMKFGCPKCVPILRCMARCLWGGTSRMNCIKKCDCGGGTPKLSDCKRCMARCKCSCMSF